MNTRESWMSVQSSGSEALESLGESVYEDNRDNTSDGKSGTIDGVSQRFVVHEHTNQLEKLKQTKKLFSDLTSNTKTGSYVTYTELEDKIFLVTSEVRTTGGYLSSQMALCNITFKIQTDKTTTVTGETSLGAPITEDVPIYFENYAIYKDSSTSSSGTDLGNALNIPKGHIMIEYQYDEDSGVKKGLGFTLYGSQYVIVGVNNSNIFSGIGTVKLICKEVVADEYA